MDNIKLEERKRRFGILKGKYADVLLDTEDPNKRLSLQGRIDELTVSIESIEMTIEKNNGIGRVDDPKKLDKKLVALVPVKKSQKRKRGRPKLKQKGIFELQ
jgi:hypothetical protein